jgi:hypothetical protein
MAPRHWELAIENLSIVIVLASLDLCCFALKVVAGSWEGGVRILTTRRRVAARQARLRLRPGERRQAMDMVVLTRGS